MLLWETATGLQDTVMPKGGDPANENFITVLIWVCTIFWASLVAQTVKNLLAMQETQALSLSREDPLEKGMATHSSIPAWRIPWTEEPGGLQSMRSQRDTTE